jgi:hypothetical protein
MLTADPIKLNNKLSKSRRVVKTREDISSPTQKKAQNLLDREKAIEKSSRLFILLNQQYVGKYGTKNPHSDVNDAITFAIRIFLERDGNPTTTRLKTLEDEVSDIGANYRNNVQAAKQAKVMKEEKEREVHVATVAKAQKDAYVRPHLSHEQTTQWSVLGTLQTLSHEEKNAEEKRKLDKKGADYRVALRGQIDRQREKELAQQAEKRKIVEDMERHSRRLEMEEDRKKERLAEKFLRDKDIILNQIDEVKRRREEEKAEAVAFQQREMARAQRMLAEEEEEKEAGRQRQKASRDRLLIENEKDKARKKDLLDERRLEEQRMQREYEEKLEREEKARANAFQSRIDNLAKIGNSFETTGAGAVAKENARKEEMRMLADIRKKEIADTEREDAKIRKMKASLREAEVSNRALVEQKEVIKAKEREEARRMGEKFQKEAMDNEADKLRVVENRKAAALKLRQNLDEQMAVTRQGQSRTSKEALTDIELKINQDIIKKLEEDPDLQERIIERLHAAPQRKNAGFKYG